MESVTKPVPGIDTPAEDDIVVQCGGDCGTWLVAQHPSHISGGCSRDEETGELREWKPTPEWVEAEAKRAAKKGSRRCVSCGPGPRQTKTQQAETKRINALREYPDA